jgi:hypothetical protein
MMELADRIENKICLLLTLGIMKMLSKMNNPPNRNKLHKTFTAFGNSAWGV